jgi:DNA repair protein RecO (recombination protein O)
MLIKVHGVVVRTQDLSSDNRYVKIFTREKGILTATVMSGRSLRASHTAATQLFCYGEFVLYSKGDRYWVREASLIESFFDLRADLTRTALASYVCDVAGDVVEENAPEPEMLSLTLNTLFAIASGAYSLSLVKAAFELRAASVLGFRPMLDACMHCAKTDEGLCLDVMNGGLVCAECRAAAQVLPSPEEEDFRTASILCLLTPGAHAAMSYVVSCPPKRVFAFRLEGEDERLFVAAAEKYLLNQLERGFATLDFYKQIAT